MDAETRKTLDLLKKSLDFFLRNLKDLFIASAWLLALVLLLGLAMGAAAIFLQSSKIYLFVLVPASFILMALIACVFSIAIIKLIADRDQGGKMSVRQAYREADPVFGPFLAVFFLSFARALWSFLLAIPSIILFAVVVDGKRGQEALDYSRAILRSGLKDFFWGSLALIGVLAVVVAASLLLQPMRYFGQLAFAAIVVLASLYAIVFSYFLYRQLQERVK